MTDGKPFAERLLWARSKAGMTQKELAEASGISAPQITRYESGRSQPRLGAVLRLARVLEIDAYDLAPELRKRTKEYSLTLPDQIQDRIEQASKEHGITPEELIRAILIRATKAKIIEDAGLAKAMEKEIPNYKEVLDRAERETDFKNKDYDLD